jgi:DNA-binding protein HU-beta
MNKGDLIEAVFNKLGGTKKASEEAVDMVFETITKSLAKGDEVAISGFGTFLSKKRQARTARNPRTGATVDVPAMQVPKFRAGKGLKEAVK